MASAVVGGARGVRISMARAAIDARGRGRGRSARRPRRREFFLEIGRLNSPARATDLTENRAADFYSIGAPYIALAADWLPIATNWTGLMPMALERNFGNLAEMYAMTIAVADYGVRPKMVDSMMVSDVGAGGERHRPWERRAAGYACRDGLGRRRGQRAAPAVGATRRRLRVS